MPTLLSPFQYRRRQCGKCNRLFFSGSRLRPFCHDCEPEFFQTSDPSDMVSYHPDISEYDDLDQAKRLFHVRMEAERITGREVLAAAGILAALYGAFWLSILVVAWIGGAK